MDYKKDKNFQRSVIIDNYEHPNRKTHEDFNDENYKSYNFSSDSCVDNLTLFVKIENGKIKNCLFNGVGCAISTASTNIMCNILIDKNKEEALEIIHNYEEMISSKNYNEDMINELNVFSNINSQPNRIKCAKISSESIKKILNGENNGR